MEKQILTDESVYPDNTVLEKALGTDQFGVFLKFIEKVDALNLTIEWRYYNDGKSWLGKIPNKKKNLGWLSIWNVGFKVTIFFTEKTIDGFYALGIDDKIKNSVKEAKASGKLLPVITTVSGDAVLDDVIRILEHKKQLE